MSEVHGTWSTVKTILKNIKARADYDVFALYQFNNIILNNLIDE